MSTKEIQRIFIANRGEIACRIIRACHELGKTAVVGYSDADRHSLAVSLAHEGIYLGASASSESYLSQAKVIEAAKNTKCDAIHPGYGFLSENSTFAAAVVKAGLIFIGPTASAMESLGDKARARAAAIKAGVPVPEGFSKEGATLAEWKKAAEKIGFPLLVKAVAGGGGRGIRKVIRLDELEAAMESAEKEAKSGFGDGQVFLEKCLDSYRHIEVQVLGDSHGNVVALGERECSLQRRRQKVWEESPAPLLSETGRKALLKAAVNLAKSVSYQNAGTLEFLVGAKEDFYFLEMNTRLQVEHPVTEMVTRLDLVKLQIQVAEGQPLPFTQESVVSQGHAIEVRVCAEDPSQNFSPATGKLSLVSFPPADGSLRIETGFRSGDEVPLEYDSLLAKVIVCGETRPAAIARLKQALEQTALLGIATNRDFLLRLTKDTGVGAGQFNISYLESEFVKQVPKTNPLEQECAMAAATAIALSEASFWEWLPSGFRNNRESRAWVEWQGTGPSAVTRVPYKSYATFGWEMEIAGKVRNGKILHREANRLQWEWDGRVAAFFFSVEGKRISLAGGEQTYSFERAEVSAAQSSRKAKGNVRSPMPGKVSKILVGLGDRVEEGSVLAVLEAMKLEHSIRAPHAGQVDEVLVKAGQTVALGAELIRLKETIA